MDTFCHIYKLKYFTRFIQIPLVRHCNITEIIRPAPTYFHDQQLYSTRAHTYAILTRTTTIYFSSWRVVRRNTLASPNFMTRMLVKNATLRQLKLRLMATDTIIKCIIKKIRTKSFIRHEVMILDLHIQKYAPCFITRCNLIVRGGAWK